MARQRTASPFTLLPGCRQTIGRIRGLPRLTEDRLSDTPRRPPARPAASDGATLAGITRMLQWLGAHWIAYVVCV